MPLRKKTRRRNSRRQSQSTLKKFESLEPRIVLDARLLISEIVASNDDSLIDEDLDSPDWIELLNAGDESIDLDGWHLTDDPEDLNKWEFPSVEVGPGEYQVVFASGKDRDRVGENLHTNFKLSSGGDYLALTRPDQTVEAEYAPNFPPQVEDVGYGIPSAVVETTLVGIGADVQVLVPTDNSLDPDLANEVIENSWVDPALDTSGPEWIDATNGVGFWDESTDPNPNPGDGIEVANSVAQFSGTQGSDGWRYGSWEQSDDSDGIYNPTDFRQFVRLSILPSLNTWTGEFWDMGLRTNNPQDVQIRPDSQSPSGTNASSEVHHAIRRWESSVTGGILIHGTIDNPDAAGDGSVAQILVDGQEVYRAEINGGSISYEQTIQVTEGQLVDFVVSAGPQDNNEGDNTIFTATIEDVSAIVGDQSQLPTLEADIASDIESELKGVNSSAFVRIPFVPETNDFDSLALNVKYQDGFIAYLNGQVVAFSNAPNPADAAWDSVASNERSIAEATEYRPFFISSAIDLLNVGSENLLAIQALNVSANDDDLLLSANLSGTRLEVNEAEVRYFPTATPGEQNGLGVEEVGPLFTTGDHTPSQPLVTDPIVVTTQVTQTFDAVSSVTLNYRVMYGATTQLDMVDDGTGDDAAAGDGIYTATIPGSIAQPGEMVRWYMTSGDASGNESRFPLFEVSNDSEEYFGTVYHNSEFDTLNPDLVMFQTFFENPNAKNNDSGTLGSLYYNGEFYDNVRFDLHGQSSRGFPKKALDVNLPEDHRFRLNDSEPTFKKFNLLSNYADKSKLRNSLSWQTRRLTGVPSATAFPVLVYENGEFFQLADFVEDADDRFLERNGLDTNNPVYKIYNTFGSVGNAEKKTAREEGSDDLAAFIAGINSNSTEFIYDNVDLAGMANYLAGFTVTSNRDCCHKNFYAYRDASGSQEWTFLPWDVDLTYGRNWGGFSLAYHDYTIYTTNSLQVGGNNNLISKLYAIPEFSEMFHRRVKTLMDEIYGGPDAGNTTIEDYVQYLDGLIGPWGQSDLDKWGQVSSGHQAQPLETYDVAQEKLLVDFLQERRRHIYDTLTQPEVDVSVPAELLFSGADVTSRYFVPGDNSINETWATRDFDDAGWTEGQFGYGFENSQTDFIDVINTRVKPIEVVPDATTLMTRVEFDLANAASVENMTLNLRYDDGVVAYINGVEVVRSGIIDEIVEWDTRGFGRSDSVAREFRSFAFETAGLNLTETGNVLAIQVANASASNSDMLVDVDVYTGVIAPPSNEPIPRAQTADATVEIVSVDFNPVSGNQDEEYLEIKNTGDTAVDISGWHLANGVDMTFRPGTVIPTGGSLYVTPSAPAFRARATGPSGGQRLFVQDSYDGHLSNFGESIEIVRADGTLASTFTYEGDPSPVQESLRVTEIMYNPIEPGSAELAVNDQWLAEDFEFLELTNTGDATLDLTGVKISNGLNFDFDAGTVQSLDAGAKVLVVRDLGAFSARYPDVATDQIAGVFASGGLSNSGETIKIEDASNSTVQEFAYDDNDVEGWSTLADGRGASLQIVDVEGDYGDPFNWTASAEVSGSPGSVGDSTVASLAINEFLSNSDADTVDRIEIVNKSNAAVSLSSYYLADSAASRESLAVFQMPDTMLGAGEYMTFDETELGFALSGFGDQIYLMRNDGTDPVYDVTHFEDYFDFGDIAAGESYGRYPDSTGIIVPLLSNTFGATNSEPRVGPVIISELQYNPGEPTAADLAIDPTIEENDLEFVEIHNPTSASISLTDWRLRGGVDLDFNAGSTLEAGETVVVVSFNPDNVDNADRVAAFRSHYGIGDEVRLIGGYAGRLADGGERLTLQRGGAAEELVIPHYLEDEVRYSDTSPWSSGADGTGNSLTRALPTLVGSDASSWIVGTPTPGSVDFSNRPGDVNQDGNLDSTDIDALFAAINGGNDESIYDVDGSGIVDSDDVTHLVENVFGTFMGDANLDGQVDAIDLNAVGIHWQNQEGGTWATGDFNGDGAVDPIDLNVVGINWFRGVAQAARVPRAPLSHSAPVVVLADAGTELSISEKPSLETIETTDEAPPYDSTTTRLHKWQNIRRSRGNLPRSSAQPKIATIADKVFEELG